MSIEKIIELEKQLIVQEYENKIVELERESQLGEIGDSKWACQRLGIKTFDTIRTTILLPFRHELEGKIVFYSDRQGVPWKFNKRRFNEWMDNNFERIEW